ncbi:MAG: carboxy-S-adenosyl-L-methionine synthase CmoA [Desulfocapsa sp.]|nr:carboxy-S-adenosyl-L-methionine synthase CmoA [Desulfocapsa sp.]
MKKETNHSLSQEKKNSSRDTLFQREAVRNDFIFDDRVAQVFDDMLDRSVPHYEEVIRSIARILANQVEKGEQVVDLGCATGTTLLRLSKLLEEKELTYLGIDNSPAMLNKARLKAELFSRMKQLNFICNDVMKIDQPGTAAFILNYTLQFIRPLHRETFLQKIYDNLRPGGLCILSEKTISHHPGLNRRYIEIYHQFKKERGYSELEIAKKREALENILIPCSPEENRSMLHAAGFIEVEPFFQWFNFVSFLAVKPLS